MLEGHMRFCCPNCGRDEEILVDPNPHCRFCHVEMIAASDYSELWMSPYIAIKRNGNDQRKLRY
jgi:hypothetical protein